MAQIVWTAEGRRWLQEIYDYIRRALFVWRFGGAGEGEIELVKYDRSGGAQLPGNA